MCISSRAPSLPSPPPQRETPRSPSTTPQGAGAAERRRQSAAAGTRSTELTGPLGLQETARVGKKTALGA